MFAHRGLALEAPENTLLAFELALAAGAAYLETDVRLTRDGVVVIAHDATIDRVAGTSAVVADLTMPELTAVDLGFGQTFCTLAEALERFPRARFNIDVKVAEAVLPVAEVIRSAAASDRVLLTSFSDARRRRLAELVPGVATSVGQAGVIGALLATWLGSPSLVRRALRGAVALQVPERFGPVRIVSRRFAKVVHAAGAEVHVWTVNDPADMERLLDVGIDGLVSDRADLAVAVVARRN
ncbi:glycerophosphoryl diester phosphodiesterase [Agromyces sp. CF514]|uniref:glycerophosphodiester phosphodiesterase family protein n=1 Tax=Agromyces sp. CF514 TaxID=1881031 RepID=UPI0008F3A00C|nr:glycerophosphodiester phosphodiesterase family protein [Agromyces sp. CF514]SFR77740.1 glycerophosphoryl diester phosphodiesterase [Agromyces sp. CF514]